MSSFALLAVRLGPFYQSRANKVEYNREQTSFFHDMDISVQISPSDKAGTPPPVIHISVSSATVTSQVLYSVLGVTSRI